MADQRRQAGDRCSTGQRVVAGSERAATMLTIRDPFSDAETQMAVASGDILRVGFVVPGDTGPFTCARVLVVGDLLRRVVEDVYSAQVLAAIVSDDSWVIEQDWQSALSVRPLVGGFSTADEAQNALGEPLDLVVTVANGQDHRAPRPPTMAVAPARAAVPYPGAEPTTARFALINVNHRYRLNVTSDGLKHSHTALGCWRDRVARWSQHPGRPIPPAWRDRVVAALNHDLNVARVTSMMSELEGAECVEPGAKFEAFTYVDRILAIDLARGLGGTSLEERIHDEP